ncbi:MAG: tyrosine-type recombinase/integrase [Candidatus Nanohaloarchaea archaeon]
MTADDLHELVDYYEEQEKYQPITVYLHGFVNHYKGDLSKGSIVQYLRYLAYLDFDPLDENPEPEDVKIEDFHLDRLQEWTRAKARKRFGESGEKLNSRNRFAYMTYLALKKYLKMADPSLLPYLPDSEQFEKPYSQPKTIYYSETQIQDLMMASENRKVFLSIALMYYAGLRSYELLHLTPEWLEFKTDRIEIEIPPKYAKGQKNNQTSEITFLKKIYGEDLKQHIKDQHNYDGDYHQLVSQLVDQESFQPVFNYKENSQKSYRELMKERYELNQKLKETAKKAGFNKAEKISSHKLRRSFIRKVYDSTKDLSRTAQVARHKSPETTQQYLHLDKEEQLETYQEAFL